MRSCGAWAPVGLLSVALASSAACGTSAGVCYLPAGDGGDEGGGVGSLDSGAGMVIVNGTLTNIDCPTVSPISVSPENGGSFDLGISIVAADGGPIGAWSWMATSGKISDPTMLNTTLTCTARGNVTVTFDLVTMGCKLQSAQITVDCE
jgi:hypothetical protein